jgi:DedD protein
VDDKLKRRLIGAAVLVSLAVIFVPMLVEEEPVPAPPVQGTNIPPREETTFKSQFLKEEVAVPTDAPQPEPPLEPAPPAVVEAPPPEEPPLIAPPRPRAPETAEKEKPKEKPAPQPVKAPEPKPAEPKPAEPKPALKPSHWVVQVGNYGTREKANSVAGALKARGLDAFVESVGQPPTYRVAVGPEEQRKQADALVPKVRAAASGDEKPIVRPWP